VTARDRPLPPLHPCARDLIESERCPRCGEPGVKIRTLIPGILAEWGCPRCEPEACAEAEP